MADWCWLCSRRGGGRGTKPKDGGVHKKEGDETDAADVISALCLFASCKGQGKCLPQRAGWSGMLLPPAPRRLLRARTASQLRWGHRPPASPVYSPPPLPTSRPPVSSGEMVLARGSCFAAAFPSVPTFPPYLASPYLVVWHNILRRQSPPKATSRAQSEAPNFYLANVPLIAPLQTSPPLQRPSIPPHLASPQATHPTAAFVGLEASHTFPTTQPPLLLPGEGEAKGLVVLRLPTPMGR